MLDTIPVGPEEFQCPEDVGVPGNVMRLPIRIDEAKGEVIVSKANMPSDKDLIHQCFMDTFKCSPDQIVGSNSFSNGEEHVSTKPGIAVGGLL